MKKIILISILMMYSMQAWADCYIKGKPYPTGAIVGQMRCGANGYWHPK